MMGNYPALVRALGVLMSAVSEDYYRSDWYSGTEDSLPIAVWKTINGEKHRGAYAGLALEDAEMLLVMAQIVGGWVKPDPSGHGYVFYEKQFR